MPMMTGASERWVWWHSTGMVTDAEMAAACDGLARFYTTVREPCVGLIVTHQSSLPSASQRRRIAEIANLEGRRHVRGLAMVFDSPVARGVVTAVNWLTTKTVPEETFGSVDEAFAWLTGQLPGPHVGELRRDWERRVPAEWRATVARGR